MAASLSFGGAAHALNISISYSAPNAWTDAMKVVVDDAVREWESIYCPPITITVNLAWRDLGTDWGLSENMEEDPFEHVPVSADLQLNTTLASQYYWDPTPTNIADDAGRLNKTGDGSIDAASVLKHELFHVIGFARAYGKFSFMHKADGDLDGDGRNEYYLDYNANHQFDMGELVMSDNGTAHTDDGYYSHRESFLMGDGGFGRGDQARPSAIEIAALQHIYGYPVHVPEPGTFALGALGALGSSAAFRRRRGQRPGVLAQA